MSLEPKFKSKGYGFLSTKELSTKEEQADAED